MQLDTYGDNQLMRACSKNLLKEIEKIIKKQTCSPEHTNFYGMTALMYACYSPEAISILIKAYGKKCKPSHKEIHNETVLTLSAQCGSDIVTKQLIDAFGWDCLPSHQNSYKNTAFTYLCWRFRENSAIYMLKKFGKKCFTNYKKEINNAQYIIKHHKLWTLQGLLLTKRFQSYPNFIQPINRSAFSDILLVC